MLYSIITINYNNREGLEKTIESVVNQSFKNYQYIIIDGGSTDGSVEVIEKYASQINYWVSEQDKGIYHAMNKGILQAHGEYVIFMNSGDCFYDSTVLDWVFQQGLQEDICIGKVWCVGRNIIKEPLNNNFSMMDLFRNHPPHQAAFIKRDLFEQGLFDETFKLVSDWIFFIDRLIFRNCSYRYLNTIIANYDMSGLSTTQTRLLKEEEKKALESFLPQRILKDYEKYKYADSPLLELIPDLNKTAGFHQWVFKLVNFLLKSYKWAVNFLV